MKMFIRNNHTGKKYYLNLVSKTLLSFCIPLSLLLYGMSVALLFDLLGFPSDKVILIMVVAYAIEILLEILDKVTIAQIIFGCFASVILLPIWIDIAKSEDINIFKNTIGKALYIIDYVTDLYHNIGRYNMDKVSNSVPYIKH
jgi:uncharacterized membrane protein YjjP (DUF1212 family)